MIFTDAPSSSAKSNFVCIFEVYLRDIVQRRTAQVLPVETKLILAPAREVVQTACGVCDRLKETFPNVEIIFKSFLTF